MLCAFIMIAVLRMGGLGLVGIAVLCFLGAGGEVLPGRVGLTA